MWVWMSAPSTRTSCGVCEPGDVAFEIVLVSGRYVATIAPFDPTCRTFNPSTATFAGASPLANLLAEAPALPATPQESLDIPRATPRPPPRPECAPSPAPSEEWSAPNETSDSRDPPVPALRAAVLSVVEGFGSLARRPKPAVLRAVEAFAEALDHALAGAGAAPIARAAPPTVWLRIGM